MFWIRFHVFFHSSLWNWRGLAIRPPGGRVQVPTGIAHFPGDIFELPPRRWVERAFDVVHWTDLPAGGHFAAMEEPAAFIDDVRTFFRPLRG